MILWLLLVVLLVLAVTTGLALSPLGWLILILVVLCFVAAVRQ